MVPTHCISSIKKQESLSCVHKPHLHIIVIEAMQLKFVHFFDTKDGMVRPTCELFSHWKKSSHTVDIFCLDNEGENGLPQNCANSAMLQFGIDYKFMAQDTPQKNLLAKVDQVL